MSISSSRLLLAGLVFSVTAVFIQWGFWSHGVISLGFNSSFVIAGFWVIVLLNAPLGMWQPVNIRWFAPLWIIGLSYALYENPWLKSISTPLLPVITAFIYSYRSTKHSDGYHWGWDITRFLFEKSLRPAAGLGRAYRELKQEVFLFLRMDSENMAPRVLTGIAIFLPISIVALTLLTSADHRFGEFIEVFFHFILSIFDQDIFWQLVAISILFLFLTSTLLCWREESRYISNGENIRRLDSIVSGVVVTGLISIYFLFIYVQIEHVFIGSLPIEFDRTEKIVKSGFWQLVILSVINVVLFLCVYKKTSPTVQILLRLFVVASGLIVISAAWRLSLYVYWYGLSYEKFFASYTVLFAIITFVLILTACFSPVRKNVARSMVFCALWFYAIATVLPIEKIIFHSNLYLSKVDNSRIDLDELTALSIDIYKDAEENWNLGTLRTPQWFRWINNNKNSNCIRPWYETNISAILNCSRL